MKFSRNELAYSFFIAKDINITQAFMLANKFIRNMDKEVDETDQSTFEKIKTE